MTDYDTALERRLLAAETALRRARAVGRALDQLAREECEPAVTHAVVRRLARELLAKDRDE